MTEQALKVGDRVKFNLNREDGPTAQGSVVRVDNKGNAIIKPFRGSFDHGTKLFNITKVDSTGL